jgi:hypothetical protein
MRSVSGIYRVGGCLLLASLLATAAHGQPAAGESPRERVDRAFERNAPAVGEPLPDIAAYDADGGVFRLSSLKGRPAVLVFGCLT